MSTQGSGIKSTTPFNAPDQWTLIYAYNCSNFGFSGNFIVTVYDGPNLVTVAVNELGAKGASATTIYTGGNIHLEINSECGWSVEALG